MRAIPLICSFLTLHPASSSDAPPNLPSEMLEAIVRHVVGSQKVDFFGYVDWLADNGWTWPWTDVGISMLKGIAEEERDLNLKYEEQRVRKQQILEKVRTFVRIRSGLPIDCTGMEAEELRELAVRLESSYEECARLSESPTWKKACMAGIFGRNTLSTLLGYLSDGFRFRNRALLVQAACFIGDIHFLDEIIDSFGILEDVPDMVLAFDIVFSGSVDFFDELLKRLPKVMEKRLDLIKEACSLNRLDILTFILEVAKPAELDELGQILYSFHQLEMIKKDPARCYHSKLHRVLVVSVEYGNLSIIRFLWLAMEAMPYYAESVVEDMMTGAGMNNHRSIIEFMLLQSGDDCMKMAQKYVKNAFKAAARGGNVEILEFLARKDKDGKYFLPGMNSVNFTRVLSTAIKTNQMDILRWFLQIKDGEYVLPEMYSVKFTRVLSTAIMCKEIDISKELLQVNGDEYVFPGMHDVNFTQVLSVAIEYKQEGLVKWLLRTNKDGECFLPKMEGADLTKALSIAIENGNSEIVKFLLKKENGEYVLPEMEDFDIGQALKDAIRQDDIKAVRFLLTTDDGKYVLPGMEDVDLTRALNDAIIRNRRDMVRVFLEMKDGKYVLPGIRVTEDMLKFGGQSPEMRELLEKHLEQQCGNM